MPFTCIVKEKIAEFRKALKDKELDIAKLLDMTTEDRTALFSEFAGENAKLMNTLFEEKLVLKNRLQGIKNWASKVGEIGRYDPLKKAKLDEMMSEYKARQQQRIFSPKENEQFLADLAEEKLGTRITKEEAKNVFDMTAKIDEYKKGFDETTGQWSDDKTRVNYGASAVALDNYMADLKGENLPLRELMKGRIATFKKTYGENKIKATFDLIADAAKAISDNSISLVASVDNSFLGRQGIKTLITHPSAWWDGAINSFKDIAKTLKGQETMDALTADIYSRPNFMNGAYETAKIIAKSEEQFPATIPERIPFVGKIFKASEVAFRGSALRMRTDLFDLLAKKAKENGVDMTDKFQIQSIGKIVNSLTARGQWGQRGEPAVIRLILWAPKMLKANIDVLTGHLGQDISPFARKQAAINLFKIVGTTATIMTVANAMKPGSAELDPRSSDFGKIKIGDTRFDMTGGAASLIVLASRLISNSTKSSSTGLIRKFGTGYGETSRFDLLVDFLSGKVTPAMGIVVDFMKGRTYEGKKPTLTGELYGGATPIAIQNFINLKDNASVDRVLGALLDVVGISTTSYAPSEVDWGENTGKELTQFREKVGDAKFKEANDLFNKQYSDWLKNVANDTRYKALTDDQ
jgi:hypothetical protein